MEPKTYSAKEKHEFDPNCPHCRPIIIDIKTGRALANTDPFMQVTNTVFDAATLDEKRAFIRVTVMNSRDPVDLLHFECLSKRISAAMEQHDRQTNYKIPRDA